MDTEENNRLYSQIISNPEEYIRTSFPQLYSALKKRFHDFIGSWEKSISASPFPDGFKSDLLFFITQNISLEIYFDEDVKAVLDMVEKNIVPSESDRRVNIKKLFLSRIIDYQFVIPELILKSLDKGISDLQSGLQSMNAERSNANMLIKKLGETKRKLSDDKRKLIDNAGKPTSSKLRKIADETRKKNGKINFKRIADKIGRSNHQVKKWCEEYGID